MSEEKRRGVGVCGENGRIEDFDYMGMVLGFAEGYGRDGMG